MIPPPKFADQLIFLFEFLMKVLFTSHFMEELLQDELFADDALCAADRKN